jgi:ECF transporter S component (folate family)
LSKITQQEIAASNNVRKEVSSAAKRITYIATFTAITLMFKTLGNFLMIGESLRISFTYFGWILAAVALGPIGGAAVGFITDVLGTFLAATGGGINPLITLGNTLFPLIVGLCYKYIPLRNKNIPIVIGTALAVVFCTMGINSAALYYMYGYDASMPFWAYLAAFRYLQPLVVSVNLAAALAAAPFARRIKLT